MGTLVGCLQAKAAKHIILARSHHHHPRPLMLCLPSSIALKTVVVSKGHA